jgi:hypothetical protein
MLYRLTYAKMPNHGVLIFIQTPFLNYCLLSACRHGHVHAPHSCTGPARRGGWGGSARLAAGCPCCLPKKGELGRYVFMSQEWLAFERVLKDFINVCTGRVGCCSVLRVLSISEVNWFRRGIGDCSERERGRQNIAGYLVTHLVFFHHCLALPCNLITFPTMNQACPRLV